MPPPYRRSLLLPLLALLFLGMISTAYAQEGVDQEKLNRGAQLYSENCAMCHGPNGEGRIGATLAKNWPSIRPEMTVRNIIENGVSGSPMVAWSESNGGPLSESQIDDLVYFILSWQTGGPPKVTPPPTYTPRPTLAPIPDVAGDPTRGAQLFAENCAVCHGPKGEGRIGKTLAKHWAGVRPDLLIKTTITNGIQGSPMPAWGQVSGGPLSEQDIDDLTAFVLSLAENAPAIQQETPAQTLQPPPAGGAVGILVIVALLAGVLIGVWVQRHNRLA